MFPGEPVVGDEATPEPELGVGGDDEPGPSVGLFGCGDRGCGPAERCLDEPERVFDVESPQIRQRAQFQVRVVWPGSPEPQGVGVTAGGFREVLDLDADYGAFDNGDGIVAGPVAAVEKPRVHVVPGGDVDGCRSDCRRGSLWRLVSARCRGRRISSWVCGGEVVPRFRMAGWAVTVGRCGILGRYGPGTRCRR